MDSFTSMSTGLPVGKKSRRGHRGRGKGGRSIAQHLQDAQQAHASGNHAMAKGFALKAVNALHALQSQQAAPAAQQSNDMENC